VAIACNTAHAWHASLQERFPQVELLHMARETARQLAEQGATRRGALMATEGTYRVRLYEQALAEGRAGLPHSCRSADERRIITRGIFEGVKAGNTAAGRTLRRASPTWRCGSPSATGPVTIIMGCTEVPLGLQGSAAVAGLDLVDPAQVLAAALARRAYG
jgi:aspartate racemase